MKAGIAAGRKRIIHAAIIVAACAIALVELNIAVVIVTGALLITFGALVRTNCCRFQGGANRAG